MSDSAVPWTAAYQAPLSFTISQSLLRSSVTEDYRKFTCWLIPKPFHGNNGGIRNTLFSLCIKFGDWRLIQIEESRSLLLFWLYSQLWKSSSYYLLVQKNWYKKQKLKPWLTNLWTYLYNLHKYMFVICLTEIQLCPNWKFMEGNSYKFSLHIAWSSTITDV